jgi:uncharacterized membrane protein YbaN (DUF454 family)
LQNVTPPGPEEPRAQHPRLSTWKRILLFVAGWTVLLVGVAGLVLPGIQGILTILIGVAILSLVSESTYRLLGRLLLRWPKLMERVEGLRHKVSDWLR